MTTEITEGLGSMSAMLLIISIIAIGAVMAIKNKIANKRRRRSQLVEGKPKSEHPDQPEQGRKTPTEDVNKQLDDLRKDVDK